MSVDTTIRHASLDELYLDPQNARLGRRNRESTLSQDKILDLMKSWSLEELAVSFLESGFWPHEALLVVQEKLYRQPRLVVVEGNRRLAALKLLFAARSGQPPSKKWDNIAKTGTPAAIARLERVPYLKAGTRQDIQAFLGFRHVTGIKEWEPAEKAEFIARLIDEHGLSYEQVRRQIGSKAPTVRQHYIAYRLLLQMENEVADQISVERVEDKFSVLYLSLRTTGVQTYLHVDPHAEPAHAKNPVPKTHLKNLVDYAIWLFGDDEREPIVTDSRLVDKFGKTLESPEAVSYLKMAKHPLFDTAYRLAGGSETELVELVERAAYDLEQALSTAHQHLKSRSLQKAVRRLGTDALQLLKLFPEIKKELLSDQQ